MARTILRLRQGSREMGATKFKLSNYYHGGATDPGNLSDYTQMLAVIHLLIE